MSLHKTCFLRCIVLILLCGAPVNSAWADKANKTRQLEKLGSNISRVENEIASAQKKQAHINKQLKRWERQISSVSKKLRDLKQKQKQLKRKLKTQSREHSKLSAALSKHQGFLGRQVKAAYQNGRQPFLKLLFNQEDPATIGRMLAYYDYYGVARRQQMVSIQQDLVLVKQLEESMRQQAADLDQVRQNYDKQHQKLLESKRKRKTTLSSLSREISSKNQQLQTLQSEKKQLEAVITNLQKKSAPSAPADMASKPLFSSLKGKLGWPTRGKLGKRYRSRIVGKLKLQGIIINAKSGQDVYAISHGRVVFADWLPGYGMVIILDHGKGYISLYGYNQSLLKEKGDWVDTGDILAQVGNSGGRKKTGLYFEVRRRGKTQNPLSWLSRLRTNLARSRP